VEPEAAIRMMAGGKHGRAVLEGQGDNPTLAAGDVFYDIAERRGQQALGRYIPLGFPSAGTPSLSAWYLLIATAADTAHFRVRRAVVPLIADNAVLCGGAAAQDRGMPGRGDGMRIRIVAVREPGSFGLQSPKAALAKQRLPAGQVITAHLVED